MLETREFFLYHVHKDDNIDAIKSYLSDNKVEVINIEQKNNELARFNSFKISVPFKDGRAVSSAEFWPDNVCIKNWHEPLKESTSVVPNHVSNVSESNTKA